MTEIDPQKCLPPEMRIQSIDDILYDIGLSVKPFSDENRKRSLSNDPKVVFISLVLYSILKICCLIVDERNPHSKYLCDFSPLIGFKFHWNLSTLVFTVSVLWLQIIYYVNHIRGIEPTFLRLFQVLSGSLSPATIGLTRASDVSVLVRVSGIVFPLMSAMLRSLPVLFVLMALTPYALKTTFVETLVFGIPSTLIMLFIGQRLSNILTVKFVYLFIICLYFRLKLKNLNQSIARKTTSKGLQTILQTLDALYREIDEHNRTYWSHFILNIWLSFGVPTMIWINAFVLLPVSILFKFVLFYCCLNSSLLFWSGLSAAASVNYEGAKSHKLLCSFASKYRLRVHERIKVTFSQLYC